MQHVLTMFSDKRTFNSILSLNSVELKRLQMLFSKLLWSNSWNVFQSHLYFIEYGVDPFRYTKINSYLAQTFGRIKQKKFIIHCWALRWYFQFYSPYMPEPRCAPSLNVNISGNWSITIQRCCFEFQEFFLPSHWHPQFLFSPSVGRRTLLLKNCIENYAFIYRILELRKSWVRPAKAWKDRQKIITAI